MMEGCAKPKFGGFWPHYVLRYSDVKFFGENVPQNINVPK